jgi:hypothetical protein
LNVTTDPPTTITAAAAAAAAAASDEQIGRGHPPYSLLEETRPPAMVAAVDSGARELTSPANNYRIWRLLSNEIDIQI